MKPTKAEHNRNMLNEQFGGNCPNDTVVMPRELTAENGAKALLIGEFSEITEIECPYCAGTDWLDVDETMTCDCCDGKGTYLAKTTVGWDTIKAIYAKAVEHLAA